MGDAIDIPWTERAIGKEEVALLLGCEPRGVLERYACRPGFPQRVQDKPANTARQTAGLKNARQRWLNGAKRAPA
jgi:hypothetical protein